MPQLRQNIITGDWVVIAPERAKRPSDFIADRPRIKHDGEKDVFTVDGNAYRTRYSEFETERVYIMTNKYPAFVESHIDISPRSHKVEDGFYRVRPSLGGHDVVVVKDAQTYLPDFDMETWQDLFNAFQWRFQHFYNEDKDVYVMPIYNHKSEAAASIWHPHAQIFSSPIVPNLVAKELHHSEKYYELNGSNVFVDMLNHELEEGVRVIAENKDFVAFTFFAARFPFEIWVLSRNQRANFMNVPKSELQNLSRICVETFSRLDKVLHDPPLNFFIHNVPASYGDVAYYNWHLEIGPRLSNYGGYELGAGTVIDIVSPEKAAMYLKGIEVD